MNYFRTVDVYYVYYRSRRPGDGDTEWEEQVVETVNNTINHMVGILMLMKSSMVTMINNTINHMMGVLVKLTRVSILLVFLPILNSPNAFMWEPPDINCKCWICFWRLNENLFNHRWLDPPLGRLGPKAVVKTLLKNNFHHQSCVHYHDNHSLHMKMLHGSLPCARICLWKQTEHNKQGLHCTPSQIQCVRELQIQTN